MPAVNEVPLCTIEECDESARSSPPKEDINSPAPAIDLPNGSNRSSLRIPSYYVQSRPGSTLSLAPSFDLNNLILLPAKAYQVPGTHDDVPSLERPRREIMPVIPPPGLYARIDSSSPRVPSYVQPRPQSTLSLAPSLDLNDFILLPAKAYQPPGTYHDVPSSARPESETIPPVSPPHGLNIWIDGDKRLSTLSLEGARLILATNPWQMERSHRPLLQNGRLVRSSILSTEKPLPPLPPLAPPHDDVAAESSKQTPTESTRVTENSPEWLMKGFPPEWSTQATMRMLDERESLHDVPGTRRETALPEEEPPRGKTKLHRASTIPKWVKDWRRSRASRAERNRYADSLEALPTCRESHLPEFVQPEDRPPDNGSRAFLQVLGGFFIMLNTFGLLQSYGVFQSFYASALLPNEAPSTTAIIGSMQMFSLLTTAFAAGLLEDFLPFRAVLFGGCIILVVSMLITSICSLWWHLFLVQGICTGIAPSRPRGMELLQPRAAVLLLVGDKLPFITALANANGEGTLGGMIYTAMAEKLLTSSAGYGWAFRAMALISFITLLPAYITLREPGQERRTAKLSFDWTILHDTPFLFLLAGLFCTFLGLFTGFFYLPTLTPLLLHHKASPSLSSNLLILANGLTIPPSLLILPLISPHLGALNTLTPLTLLTSFTFFLWTGTASTTSLIMLTCAYGVCAGGVLSLVLLAIGELMAVTTRVPEPYYLPRGGQIGLGQNNDVGGIWMGVLYAGSEGRTVACRKEARCRLGILLATVAVASLVGMPLAGTMVEGRFGAQAFAGGFVLLGAMLFVGTRVAKVGWTGVKV